MKLERRAFLRMVPGMALAAGSARTAFAAEEPLRVGSILSVTGPAAFLGEDMKAGLQIAVDEINAAGGIAGRKDRLDFLRRREPDPEGDFGNPATDQPGQGPGDRQRRQYERHSARDGADGRGCADSLHFQRRPCRS